MLVLTRKAGDRIVINEDIVVTVTKVQGKRICLAIEAPKEVRIRRGELKEVGKDDEAPAD